MGRKVKKFHQCETYHLSAIPTRVKVTLRAASEKATLTRYEEEHGYQPKNGFKCIVISGTHDAAHFRRDGSNMDDCGQ